MKPGPVIIAIVVLLVAMIAGVFYLASSSSVTSAKKKAAQKAAEYARTHPPPLPIRIGKEKVLHRFGPDGCVTVPLAGNWSDYPKGGAISITSLATGQRVVDEPGTKHTWSLPNGDYQVCKKDPGAWGVEIWQ